MDLDGKKANSISINYSKKYVVGYEYDEKDKIYYRTINGERLKDKESEKEISTTNIIVERTTAKVLDDVGRLGISNIGENRGYFLTGGKLMEIVWNKPDRTGRTVYKDLKGNEIQVNKGITWIQVVPDYVKVEVKE